MKCECTFSCEVTLSNCTTYNIYSRLGKLLSLTTATQGLLNIEQVTAHPVPRATEEQTTINVEHCGASTSKQCTAAKALAVAQYQITVHRPCM